MSHYGIREPLLTSLLYESKYFPTDESPPRTVLGDWQVTQQDFVTAFLNPPLDTELYMKLPPGIGKPGQVAKLLKTLYGLKQSPRLWFEALARLFASLGLSIALGTLDLCWEL